MAVPLLHFLLFFIHLSKRVSLAQMLGDDTACLAGVKASLQDASGKLSEWKPKQLATPCNPPLNGVVCNNERVFSLTLNSSGLSGSIPRSLVNCSYLQTLDLSSNQLSGSIPPDISNLSYLTILNFSDNHLTGPIPPELSTCVYLNIIDLHSNQLSGIIPGQLGSLPRLRVFDVSYNRLTGAIPSNLGFTSTGAPRFNASSFQGNKGLYGFPLPPKKSHSLSVLAIVGIGLGSGLFSLIASFAAVCIWLRVREHGYAAQEGKISQLVNES